MKLKVSQSLILNYTAILKLNILATWCEELTHLKRPWFWERLKAGGEEDDRGWDGWMDMVWVDSSSWRWTGRPGELQFMGSQRVGRDWVTELNWTEQYYNNWNSMMLAQIWTHRPMKQHWESRNKSIHIWTINLRQRNEKHIMEKG